MIRPLNTFIVRGSRSRIPILRLIEAQAPAAHFNMYKHLRVKGGEGGGANKNQMSRPTEDNNNCRSEALYLSSGRKRKYFFFSENRRTFPGSRGRTGRQHSPRCKMSRTKFTCSTWAPITWLGDKKKRLICANWLGSVKRPLFPASI